MVRLGNPAAAPPAVPAAVKVEVEDPSDEAYAPANKRSKLESGAGTRMVASHPMPYNLLDEPSPLGLRLRKSPSLLDLIQMRISQVSSVANSCITNCENSEVAKKDLKSSAVSATSDKMKASNFPASFLRIGTWERASKYEGDLVAKCYFAKHKLVWEVLENGLKSKIEIQWSDITALKATCPENGHSTLDIVLARQPLFFRETNPQPRKHTLWQVTEDFTGGQASAYRRHILQCPPGFLDKHFEKLIQCDQRLKSLSQQPDIILESPYFESQCSVFEDQDESKSHSFINLHGASESKISRFPDPRLPSGASLACIKSELRDPVDTSCLMVKESASPCSVMDSRATDGNSSSETELKDPNSQEKFNVPGLRASISMSDLVNHIGHCISEKFDSGNAQLSDIGLSKKSVLEEISQYLFTDSQISAPDEQSLMSRVNSFCCLLQKDSSEVQNLQVDVADSEADEDDDEEPVLTQGSNSKRQEVLDNPATVGECVDASVCKHQPNMSRKDSFGDLLLHLPRIASLPQFLFNIIEDSEEQSS